MLLHYLRKLKIQLCIAAEHLLRCRPTFSKSLMVSMTVSKLGCSPLFFVEPGIRVDGCLLGRATGTADAASLATYCWWHYAFQQDTAPAHHARDTVHPLQQETETWSSIPQTVIDEAIDEWGLRLRACVKNKATSLRALAVTDRLFSEPPTFCRRK